MLGMVLNTGETIPGPDPNMINHLSFQYHIDVNKRSYSPKNYLMFGEHVEGNIGITISKIIW